VTEKGARVRATIKAPCPSCGTMLRFTVGATPVRQTTPDGQQSVRLDLWPVARNHTCPEEPGSRRMA
jgi:LSD1 subclass zinc finger protein